jgi:hypothetical protein
LTIDVPAPHVRLAETTVVERSGSAEFKVGAGSGAENRLGIGDSSHNYHTLLRSTRAFQPRNLTGALPTINTGLGALSACTPTTTTDLPTWPGQQQFDDLRIPRQLQTVEATIHNLVGRTPLHTDNAIILEGYRKPFSVSLLTGVSVPQ